LEPGWTYVSDLTGCTVWDGGREIGTIAGVQFGTGEAPVLVIRRGQEEFLVPFATEFLETVDAASQQVRMRLPEGMLTINAPLTAEEKAQQASGRGKKKAPG
jgi:16S rRNA processing protein RimM